MTTKPQQYMPTETEIQWLLGKLEAHCQGLEGINNYVWEVFEHIAKAVNAYESDQEIIKAAIKYKEKYFDRAEKLTDLSDEAQELIEAINKRAKGE